MSATHDQQTGGRLLTAGEVAELLAVPESWVREATREQKLPYLALGRYRRYEKTAVDAWLAEQRQGPPVSPHTGDLPPRGV